jgi:hypothetical protein
MRYGISVVHDRRAAISNSTISYHRTPEPIVRSSPQ